MALKKGKKAEIKKLMDFLHEKPQGSAADKGQPKGTVGPKGSKGHKNSGSYRPKI